MLGSVSRGAGDIGDEAWRGSAGLAAGREVYVASGAASEAERLGGGFCASGAGGAAGAGAGFANGDVPFVLFGIGGVCTGAPFFGIERAELGELVGGDSEEMRGGNVEERVVSAEEVFWGRGVGEEGYQISAIRYLDPRERLIADAIADVER